MKIAAAVAMASVGSLLVPAAAVAHGANQGPPPTDAFGIVTAWHLDFPVILALIAAVSGYLAAVAEVNAGHPGNRWSRRRTAAFLLGVGAIGLALLSPFDSLSDDLLVVHMAQHLLLVSVATPLLAASGIGTLALRVASSETRQRVLLPFLHSRVVSALTFPVVGWVAFAGVMWFSHFTSLYNAALLDDSVHAVEHLLYMVAAALFWWPLLSPDPLRWRLHPGARLIALLASMPPMSFLAVTIASAATPLYAAYLGRGSAFGVDALTDQRVAGSFMWVVGDLGLLIPAAYVLVLLLRHEEAATKRIDAQLDRQRHATQSRSHR